MDSINEDDDDLTLSSSTSPCLKKSVANNSPNPTVIPAISKTTPLLIQVPTINNSNNNGGSNKKRISIVEPSDFDHYYTTNKDHKNSINFNNNRRRRSSLASVSSAVFNASTILCHRISDVLASTLIVLPLTVGFWRGIWIIMDYYSAAYHVDPWASILIGLIIPFSFHYFQTQLRSTIHPDRMNFTIFYLISRFLLLLHSFGSVNQWRGLWVFYDQYTGLGYISAMSTMIGGVGLCIIFKVFCNNLAVPLFIGVDDVNNVHDCPLRFKSSPEKKMRYFWDVVWSVIVVQSLVISAWRGLWTLADTYLYPEDPILSAVITIGIGNGLVIILCIFQPAYYEFISKLKGFHRLVTFDFVTLFGYIGTVLSWRGLWNLFGILIVFEDAPLMGEWLTTGVGTIGCILLGCISTVVIRGAGVDGEEAEDGGVVSEWSISYVSLLRERNHNVPFPEPWLFRYFCTKQRMTPKERLRRMSEFGVVDKIRRASSAFLGFPSVDDDINDNTEYHIEVEVDADVEERMKKIPGPETII